MLPRSAASPVRGTLSAARPARGPHLPLPVSRWAPAPAAGPGRPMARSPGAGRGRRGTRGGGCAGDQAGPAPARGSREALGFRRGDGGRWPGRRRGAGRAKPSDWSDGGGRAPPARPALSPLGRRRPEPSVRSLPPARKPAGSPDQPQTGARPEPGQNPSPSKPILCQFFRGRQKKLHHFSSEFQLSVTVDLQTTGELSLAGLGIGGLEANSCVLKLQFVLANMSSDVVILARSSCFLMSHLMPLSGFHFCNYIRHHM